LELHELSADPGARKPRRRLGRGHGSGRGKTAGKGTKGQKARAGGKAAPGFEGGALPMIKRLPFKRGVGFFNPNRTTYYPVNVRDLGRFDAGSEVGPTELAAMGLVPDLKGRVKVLGDGALDRALTVRAHAFSAQAKTKLEAAGGQAIVVNLKGEVVPEKSVEGSGAEAGGNAGEE
jgi:large subunit ribosomal protein L15